jgi:3-hydroxyanthranilate 3,4-dioxygenase
LASAGAALLSPVNLQGWIDRHRHLLKPPVGNVQIWKDTDFIVMVIGGPNARTDYHDDPFEEVFYQLEGEITLRVMENGKPQDIPLRAGEMLMLPPHVRHSPQRPAGSVGIVIERTRPEGTREAFEWYCEHCHALVHRREVQVRDIEVDMPPVFDEYYGDPALRLCSACGYQNPGRPAR